VFWSRAKRLRITIALLLLSDIVAVAAAGLAASFIRFDSLDPLLLVPGSASDIPYWMLSLVVAFAWPVIFFFEQLYDTELLFWGSGEFRRSARAVTIGTFVLIAVDYALQLPGVSREWLALTWVFSMVLVMVGRMICRRLVRTLRTRGVLQRPALIVGANSEAERLAGIIGNDPGLGIRPMACLQRARYDDQPAEAILVPGVPIVGTAGQLCEKLESIGADVLVIASSDFSHDQVSSMLSDVRAMKVDVYVSSGLYEVLASRVVVRELSGVPIIAVRGISLTPAKIRLKRTFYIAVALATVLFGLPLWLLVAAAIKADSPGPVFFLQERIGFGGKTFWMFKFRSMHIDAEQRLSELALANEAEGPIFKIKNDPRITRVGAWLRRGSIDEFPQLLNVIIGDMSIVGPRPPLPSEVQLYQERHWKRLEVSPGMTGLWQVSGRSDLSFEEMVRLDIYYIENWTLAFDVALMLRTLPAVFSSRGAY